LAALKTGASFEELAKKESIARSRRGLEPERWLYKGKTDPALEKAAFDLEKDTPSDIIKTKKGFYIIKVLEKREPRYFTFDEAREKIRAKLFWDNKEKIINNYYDAAGVNTHPTEPGVLVTIGDERITEEAIAPILAKAPEKDREKLKLRWIEYFVETGVFSKEAEKVGLDKNPEVMRKLRLGRDRVLAKAFRERFIAGKAEVTDEDIAQYYASHQEAFRVPVKVRAKGILVKTRKEAEEILKELKEEGTPFGYVAQKKSLHPRAEERAGEIGWFGRGQKDPALEEAAFSLEKGQMSDIIQTKEGFEIIKVMDKKGGGVQPLDEVKQSIKMTLMAENLDKEKERYYQKAGVKVLGVFE
jgi:parvulin-like peptidyl-prolyl isomerase